VVVGGASCCVRLDWLVVVGAKVRVTGGCGRCCLLVGLSVCLSFRMLAFLSVCLPACPTSLTSQNGIRNAVMTLLQEF
jgi:hypothetical protein